MSARALTAYRRRLSTPALSAVFERLIVAGATNAPTALSATTDDEWQELLSCCVEQRVLPNLLRAAAADTDLANARRLQLAHESRLMEAHRLSIAWAVDDFTAVMGRGGITWLAVKGLATSVLLYEDSNERVLGDLDVVVLPAEYDRACMLLHTADAVSHRIPAQGKATERYAPETTFAHVSGVEIDLHRRIEGILPHSSLSVEAMFEAAQSITWEGRDLQVPGLTHAMQHALIHLSTGISGNRGLAACSTLNDILAAKARFPAEYRVALRSMVGVGLRLAATWADGTAECWRARASDEEPPERSGDTLSVRVFDLSLAVPGLHAVFRRMRQPARLRRLVEAGWPSAEYSRHHGITRTGHLLGFTSRLGRR